MRHNVESIALHSVDDTLSAGFRTYDALRSEVSQTVIMDREDIQALIGGAILGSVLSEGDPSTGKTMASKALAKAMGGKFGRIQGTSEVQPGDVTGVAVWKPDRHDFDFIEGPIFSNVVLVDEINRIPPKGQSGILQAMQEKSVTPAGSKKTLALPRPFMVIATQNPVEIGQGTYPLTKANIDRFMVSVPMNQTLAQERAVLDLEENPHEPNQRADLEDVEGLREAVARVTLDADSKDEIVSFNAALRQDSRVDAELTQLSGSRKNIFMMGVAKFAALTKQRTNVDPEDLAFAARYVLPHRIELTDEAVENGLTAEQLVQHYIENRLG